LNAIDQQVRDTPEAYQHAIDIQPDLGSEVSGICQATWDALLAMLLNASDAVMVFYNWGGRLRNEDYDP